MKKKFSSKISFKEIILLSISVFILLAIYYYSGAVKTYMQILSDAEQYGLHTNTKKFQESFSESSFYGPTFIDSYLISIKNPTNDSINLDSHFPIQFDKELFKKTYFSILLSNPDTAQIIKKLDVFPQQLQNNLTEFKKPNPSSIFYPSVRVDYELKKEMINKLILNVLLTESDKNDLDLKLKSLLNLMNILFNERPHILTTIHSLSKANQYVDLIYLLYLLDKIDSRTALQYLDEIQSLPINQSIKNAIKAEYYFVFTRVNQIAISHSDLYVPAFKFNMIYAIKRYIQWIENFDIPYYQLNKNLKNDNPFPYYVPLAKNYSYKWHELLYQRDTLLTRVILLKTAIQFDEETKSAEQFVDTSNVLEPISGNLPLINQLDELTVVHSSELPINDIEPQINLFDGKYDLYFILNTDTETP